MVLNIIKFTIYLFPNDKIQYQCIILYIKECYPTPIGPWARRLISPKKDSSTKCI